MLNNSISCTRSHNMVNFDLLEAEIGLPVWGTPGNFNLYRVLASLLQRRRSTEVNQTLHDVWPSRVLVQYIYTLGGGLLAPNEILPRAKFTLPEVLRYRIASITAQDSSSVRQPNFAAFSRGRHLFGGAASTLGIGPHSSSLVLLSVALQ